MNRLAPDADDARFIRRVLILLLIVGVTAAAWRAGNLLILAFGSVLGAITIHAIADFYTNNLRAPAKLALPLAVCTVLGVIAFLIWLFGVQFAPQVNALVTQLPALLQQLETWLSQTPVGAKIVDAVQSGLCRVRASRRISVASRAAPAS